MIDRAGQTWELEGGAIILVVRSYRIGFSLAHDVLIVKAPNRSSRFTHVEGSVSMWHEGRLAWEEPGGDRWRLT